MRELTEKTDRGRTFYRLLSFLPTSYREPFSFFFLFFTTNDVVSIRQKRFHAFDANFFFVNPCFVIINDEKAWTKIESRAFSKSFREAIINLSIKLNR